MSPSVHRDCESAVNPVECATQIPAEMTIDQKQDQTEPGVVDSTPCPDTKPSVSEPAKVTARGTKERFGTRRVGKVRRGKIRRKFRRSKDL